MSDEKKPQSVSEKVQSVLKEMFPDKDIQITMHYEMIVDNIGVPSIGPLLMDMHLMHGALTIGELAETYAKDIRKHLGERPDETDKKTT